MTRLHRHGLGALGALAFLALWEISARFVWRDAQVLPSPTQAIAAAAHYLTAGELAAHIGISLSRIVGGFTLGAAAGIALGVASGWYAWLGRIVRPIVDLLRPIPPLAWIPIAIVWFGLGEPSKWFVIFLGAFFPIFTNAYRGMASIPPVLLRAARTMDVDGARLLFKVAIPAAMPDVATGLRVGFGLSFGTLVAAELIAAQEGLGFRMQQAQLYYDLSTIFVGLIAIGVLGLLMDRLLLLAERHLTDWQERR